MSSENLTPQDANEVVEGPFSAPWQNSDAVLVVEEKELHVHSNILSIASPHFDKMFNGNFKEAQTKRVCRCWRLTGSPTILGLGFREW